jgi:hypothetical protein
VDVETVVGALVAEPTARLEAAITEVPERMVELVQREGLPGRGHGPGHGRRGRADAPAAADDEAEDDRGGLLNRRGRNVSGGAPCGVLLRRVRPGRYPISSTTSSTTSHRSMAMTVPDRAV